MFRVLQRAWMPLTIVAIVLVGGFTVHCVRGYFGDDGSAGASQVFEDTEPFHPKIVIYEIFSPNGTVADVNYLDLDAEPQRLDGAPLPWSLTLETTNPAVSPNIVAQGYSDTIGCRIIVDGE